MALIVGCLGRSPALIRVNKIMENFDVGRTAALRWNVSDEAIGHYRRLDKLHGAAHFVFYPSAEAKR